MNNKIFVGNKLSSIEKYPDLRPYTGVALIVDDENEYRAGEQTGNVLEITCPYGTQAMANNIFKTIANQTYTGFTAQNAELPVDAELGDGITVAGLYSILAYQDLTFGPGHMSDISAPGQDEPEPEVKYVSETKREFNRKIAQTRSYITRTTEEIRLTVEGLDGNYSELKQTIDGFTFSSSEGEVKIRGSAIEAGSLNLSGLITFDDLEEDLQKDIDSIGDMVTEEIVHTLISEDLVESPTIKGSNIYGAVYHDINGNVNLDIRPVVVDETDFVSAQLLLEDTSGHQLFRVLPVYGTTGTSEPIGYTGSSIGLSGIRFVSADQINRVFTLGEIRTTGSVTFKFWPGTTVDFTGANVIGLNN